MTVALSQDVVLPAYGDRDAMLGEIGTSWNRLSKQELSEPTRDAGLADQVVVMHRRDDLVSMDETIVPIGGDVERSGPCDAVVGGLVRPAARRQRRPAGAVVAAARQGGHS